MKDKLSELTKREVEVLKLIASGMFNKEIASTLCISERTVKIMYQISLKDRGIRQNTGSCICNKK